MKRMRLGVQTLVTAGLMVLALVARGQLVIPGADGSDGPFAASENFEVDLSQAVTGTWTDPGSGAGVYDPQMWAVVFKYSSVDVPSNVTLTFKNHPSGAPVVWLVNGDVNIAGTVSLNGSGGDLSPENAQPGPGGFRGGNGRQNVTEPASGGFGPGGGSWGRSPGSHVVQPAANPFRPYGNPRILPLIGGSGGGGRTDNINSGGGGGGAILIGATGSITLDGRLHSNGGRGNDGYGGGGSAGAIRFISDSLAGTGRIEAIGGSNRGEDASEGRIRLEANSVSGSISTFPSVNVVRPDDPVLIWPPDGAPTVRVVSVGPQNAPTDPRSSLELGSTDLVLETTDSIDIVVETTNLAPDINSTSVKVRITPKFGEPFELEANPAGGTESLATWVATYENVPENFFFAVQARADRIQAP